MSKEELKTKEEGTEEVEEKEEEEEQQEQQEENTEKLVKDLLKSSTEEVKEEILKYVDKELEKKRKKAGIYNPEVQEKENRKEKNARFKKLMKAVGRGDYASAKELVVTKDHSTSDPSEIVDAELAPEILHLQEEYGVARQLFRTLQLTKNSYKSNELATDITASWVDEGNTIAADDIDVTQNELTLDKLAVIASFTNELLEDAEVDIVGFITQRVAEVFAEKEDDRYLGDDTYGLINTATDSIARLDESDMSSSTGMDFGDKLLDLQEEVSKSVRDRGKYVMSFSVYNYIRKLRDDQNAPIFKELTESGGKTIHGKPIVISDALPSVSDADQADEPILMFGDFERGVYLGYKGGIRIDRATQGDLATSGEGTKNLFQTDRQAVRFVQRTGYAQVLSNTVAVLKTKDTT